MQQELLKEENSKSNNDVIIAQDKLAKELETVEKYIKSGEFTEAEVYLKGLLELDEKNAQILNHLGVVYFNLADYNKAENRFLKALKIDPNLMDVYFNLGMLYQKRGEFRKALTYYKVVAENIFDDPEVFYLMGQCAQSANMINEAKAFYAESFRLSPIPKTALDLSIIYIAQEEYKEAEKMISYLIKMMSESNSDPLSMNEEMEPLHFTMGLLLVSQNRYEEAMKSFYNAVLINDKNEQSYNYLGECCFELGLNQEAESFFSKAIKLDQSYTQPIMNLGKFYYSQGKYSQAILAMQRLIEIINKSDETSNNKEKVFAYNLLGKAYLQSGDKDKAIKALSDSLEIEPNQPEIASLISKPDSASYKRKIISIDD